MKGNTLKYILVAALAVCMAVVVAGCSSGSSSSSSSSSASASSSASSSSSESASSSSASSADADQAAADEVAELIDAIYVQERTATTDADCEAAKAAWDALTPAQQELVEGEEADPGYFGDDTGDASKDDPLNDDNIGENEILVVSFGTSFNDSRVASIGAIEKAIQAAFPDWSVRRAFTAQIIINHIQARDGEKIDNVEQALERAEANGVKNLVVAPTHLMHGAEYDELMAALRPYESKMNIGVSEPLLGEVGADATVINADKQAVAEAVVATAVQDAGFTSLEEAAAAGTAFVLMGHGTSHTANVTYDQMQTMMDQLGYTNVFIGTVEGEPEDTECSAVIDKVKEAGFKNVILRPLMVVAGDHANNDMADPEDEESWFSQFTDSGAFDSVECQINGLGEIPAVQELYVKHVTEVVPDAASTASSKAADVAPGTYEVAVTLEGGTGKATVASPAQLVVAEDGTMMATIVWSSPNYDQMIVDGLQYLPQNTSGNSTFEIPVAALDVDLAVQAETTAMSEPHMIDYTLHFDSSTLS